MGDVVITYTTRTPIERIGIAKEEGTWRSNGLW